MPNGGKGAKDRSKAAKPVGGTDENGALVGPVNPEGWAGLDTVHGDDDVSKATRKVLAAETPAEEVKAQAEIVKANPESGDTPSGYATLAAAGVSDDVERAAEYGKAKRSRRWDQ